jgi:uncharacterized membrane protein
MDPHRKIGSFFLFFSSFVSRGMTCACIDALRVHAGVSSRKMTVRVTRRVSVKIAQNVAQTILSKSTRNLFRGRK